MNRQRGIATGWLYLIGLVVLIAVLSAAVAGIYHNGKKAGMADIQGQWDTANRLQREREMKQAAEAEKAKGAADAKAKVVYRTITQTVDKYIDRPIYRNVCLDSDGLRDANAALLGTLTPTGKPDGTVPKPDAAQ